MTARACKLTSIAAIAFLAAAVFPACNRADDQVPSRLYNRMVYVRTESGEENFVNMPGHHDLGSPSLSPDGKWVAFDALTIGNDPKREAWVVGVDGAGLRKLCDASTPRWSPDGKRLLMSRVRPAAENNERADVFEFDVATGKEKPRCEGRFPDWSPDGKQIAYAMSGKAFNAGVHAGSKIWIAAADGTGGKELCEGNWPSWSPDGKKIAYCVQADGKPGEIWTIDLATKKTAKIALGHYRAQWTGDSKGFVCNGSFPIPAGEGEEKIYSRAAAHFWLDRPMQPDYFSVYLDNPWSPCISRDGKTIAMIVDSVKRHGEDNK